MERYIVNKEIGSGSFGKVFMVDSKMTGISYVAKQIDLTKLLNKRHRKEAEREIEVLSKLKHPNIVRYKEAFSNEIHLYIIMELCDAGDLHNFIQSVRQKNDRISDNQIMQIFVQICLALNYIHKNNILHRDLKSRNIFLKKGNTVKLGDFGVAKILENSFDFAETCIGSPFYISPEICENKLYDKKSDLWALGCVLFEMTTLRYAFSAKNMKALITKIVTGEHTTLPANTNQQIRHIIKKLLNVDPKQRPTTADILSWPFVADQVESKSCKIQKFAQFRSKSGEDLRKSTVNDLNFKHNNKRILSVARSSLNLASSSITDPETKYKTSNKAEQKYRIPKSPCRIEMIKKGTGSKEKLDSPLDVNKIKKMPKSDSLYFSLIEASNKNSQSLAADEIGKPMDGRNSNNNNKNCDDISHIIEFEKSLIIIDKDVATFTENNKKRDENEKNVMSPSSSRTSPIIEQKIQGRKRWSNGATDNQQLISLLSEADLVSTFSPDATLKFDTALFKGNTDLQPSIDEMLFANTTDLSHIPVLKPQKIFYCDNGYDRAQEEKIDCQKIEMNIDEERNIDDATYCISRNDNKFSIYEKLEQRRRHLEQLLGIERFLEGYKWVEKNCCDVHKMSISEIGNIMQVEYKLGVSKNDLNQIWMLVRDDFFSMT